MTQQLKDEFKGLKLEQGNWQKEQSDWLSQQECLSTAQRTLEEYR